MPISPVSSQQQQSFPANCLSAVNIAKSSVIVHVLDDESNTEKEICFFLQELIPEICVLPASAIHTPPDILFYAIASDTLVNSREIVKHQAYGAALVAITESSESIPNGLQCAIPMFLSRPITKEGLLKIIEPLRNHLALRWLQRGMDEIRPHSSHSDGTTEPIRNGQKINVCFAFDRLRLKSASYLMLSLSKHPCYF